MTNKMWGGRFASSPAAIMEQINASISFDKRLWRQDIAGSKAHAAMLAATGILTKAEANKIVDGLDQIATEIESGKFKFSTKLEDIHLNIESRLKDLIGPLAGKLHTARSRNDQVATDFRLYIRDEIDMIDLLLAELELALAEKALCTPRPSCPASPICRRRSPSPSAIICLAYVEMFARDQAEIRRRAGEIE